MTSWLISLIAVISVTLCLFLWFRDVRRIMRERKSTVESAGGQLAACREKSLCQFAWQISRGKESSLLWDREESCAWWK